MFSCIYRDGLLRPSAHRSLSRRDFLAVRTLGFLYAVRVLCGKTPFTAPSPPEISLRYPSFGVQSPPSCPNEKRSAPLAAANLIAQNPRNFPRAPLRSS